MDARPTQIHEKQIRKDIQITKAGGNAVIKSLKTGKAFGEDGIKPETLEIMNRSGVRWLTRVCQVACETGQVPKQWQTTAVIPIHQKGDWRKCTNHRGISLNKVSVKSMPSVASALLRMPGLAKSTLWSRLSIKRRHTSIYPNGNAPLVCC